MKPRKQPKLGTWLLELFCSEPEGESIAGDLVEQYQRGRGRLWYWRQIVGIVLSGVYGNVVRRPLLSTHGIPMGLIVTTVFILLSLVMVLLSDISLILLTPVIVGSYIAALRWHARRADIADLDHPQTVSQSNGPALVRIDSSKIAIRGGLGAGILIVILLTAALHDVALLRVWALPGLLAGPLVAVWLRIWAKHHPRDLDKEWPSILPK